MLIFFCLILFTVCSFGQLTVGVAWDKGSNQNQEIIGTYIHISTNDIATTTNKLKLFVPPLIYTNDDIIITTNVLFSMYATAVDTNLPMVESDPSNQIRFQLIPFFRNGSATFTLLSYTNVDWSKFELIEIPKNGFLSGTLPDLIYTPTNETYFRKDGFVYKSSEVFSGTNINYYYGIHIINSNKPPTLSDFFGS